MRYGKPAGRIPIAERTDPGVASLVAVNRYGDALRPGDRVFHLRADALAAFQGLRAKALTFGHGRELFTLTSAYRSAGRQAKIAADARLKHGKDAGTWVAQNRSEHITGRAFDLNLGLDNSSENAQSKAFNALPAYQWLRSNAADFGLNSYDAEPWHWSYNIM
jgi:LAS superfamily LD-carboxypeptidase LdcB